MMKPKNTQWKYMFDINEYLWTIPYFINYLFKNSQFSLSSVFNSPNVLSNVVLAVPGELPRLQGNSWALVPCLRWLWPSGICNISKSHVLWSLRRNPFTALLHIWQFWSRIFTNRPLSSTPSMRQCWDSCKTWALRRWFRFPFLSRIEI